MHFSHVTQTHRLCGIGPHHDIAYIFQFGDRAFRTHHQHFFTIVETARTVVAVVHLQRIAQPGQTDAARGHAGIVRHHFEGAHQTTQ